MSDRKHSQVEAERSREARGRDRKRVRLERSGKVADALDALLSSGYAEDDAGAIRRALIEAAERSNAAMSGEQKASPLEELVGRFVAMAEAREKAALNLLEARASGAAISAAEAAAAAYRRCADEVARVAAGEIPPAAGMRWF